MKNLFNFLLFSITIFGCDRNNLVDYRVQTKDSANFSVFISMLYPLERLMVTINDKIVLDVIGMDSTGSPTSYNYYLFPDSIRKIHVFGSYENQITFDKIFQDTLVCVAQRSVVISRPFPRGMTKETYRPYGYVPIDSAERMITLVDDAEHYKDTWRH